MSCQNLRLRVERAELKAESATVKEKRSLGCEVGALPLRAERSDVVIIVSSEPAQSWQRVSRLTSTDA